MKIFKIVSMLLIISLSFTVLNLTRPAEAAAKPNYQKMLTIGEVSKVSGISGLKLVPFNPKKGAGGDLNFATSDDTLVLIVRFYTVAEYQKWKNDKWCYNGPLKGIGDEAFDGPKGFPAGLYFRKGQKAAALTGFVNNEGKMFLTMDQVKQLAKIVEGRL